jgi:ribosomal protein S2
MLNMLASSVRVDRRFIGGVMFNMLSSSVVDRRFIGGVMFNQINFIAIVHVFWDYFDNVFHYD